MRQNEPEHEPPTTSCSVALRMSTAVQQSVTLVNTGWFPATTQSLTQGYAIMPKNVVGLTVHDSITASLNPSPLSPSPLLHPANNDIEIIIANILFIIFILYPPYIDVLDDLFHERSTFS